MRRLVVCCDGTWDTPAGRTNVSLLADALEDSPTQVVRYLPGVGATGGPVSRVLGGALGIGLNERVREAYRWLAQSWRPGDVVVLFGFSRGAFTVRSLAGMLASCGLVALDPAAPDREQERLVERVFRDGYQRRLPLPDVAVVPGFGPDDDAPLAFLGVWDTVGALGVPRSLGLTSTLLSRRIQGFHDLTLAPDVRHARHALALDERRGPFVPALWATPPPGRHASFEQLWFPGVHGDVGGSADRPRALSDITLRWMAEEATACAGLTWRSGLPGGPGDPAGPLDPGPSGIWRLLSPRPRSAPRVAPDTPEVHPAAVARRAAGLVPPYRPGRVPAPDTTVEVSVPADEPWAETGLFLVPGRHRVAAAGRWTDHGAPTTPAGFVRWPPRAWPDYLVGALADRWRRLVRALTTRRADVPVAPRVSGARRMALAVSVANDVLAGDGTLTEGTTVVVGADGTAEIDVPRAGYLYAYANDAWTGYGGNGGAARLSVTRG